MSNQKAKRARWRALLTDTLPYEVPVIFSNDRRYAALVAELSSEPVKKLFARLVNDPAPGTIPYEYTIAKETAQRTTLGVIHPIWQMRMAEFYEAYAQSLVDYCARSEFTLRAPIAPTPVFSDEEMAGGRTFKLGIPHVNAKQGEIDVSHVVSYFAYGRYNLLSKFIESQEFLSLEKKFEYLRTLDVSKCFFSIYTHTITWAVKEREFAKEHRHAYSFEGRFDDLMQKANHNETHGIVVGPETSRIFAEIIFQDIDRAVQRQLSQLEKLEHNTDYAVRRYVDDFYVFARSPSILTRVESEVRAQLQRHKMYLNEKKITTLSRPFVSSISLARREIAGSLAELHSEFDDLPTVEDMVTLRRKSRLLRQKIKEIRFIAAKHQIGFHTVSGWLLSSLRGILKRVSIAAAKQKEAADRFEVFTDIAADVLDVVFYVCALDARVRTSYSLCQVLWAVGRFGESGESDHVDRLRHVASDGLQGLISSLAASAKDEFDSVELYNLLICGAHYIGRDFFRSGPAREALTALAGRKRPSYFSYITAKFCLLKDSTGNAELLKTLNSAVLARLAGAQNKLFLDAECYLLFCDLVSAPDLTKKERRKLIVSHLQGKPTHKTIAELQRLVGFVDWDGMQIEHTLQRKQLRPVYAFV